MIEGFEVIGLCSTSFWEDSLNAFVNNVDCEPSKFKMLVLTSFEKYFDKKYFYL